jgi:hypothetical protein
MGIFDVVNIPETHSGNIKSYYSLGIESAYFDAKYECCLQIFAPGYFQLL